MKATPINKNSLNEEKAVAICPICGNTNSRVLFHAVSWEYFERDKVYEIRRCNNCQVVFTNPFASSEELSVLYSQGVYRATSNRLSTLVEVLLKVFQYVRLSKVKTVIQQGKLLDVGCGKGKFLAYAAAYGWDVYGVEPSENNRTVARSRLGNRIVSSFDELGSIQKFDVITLWHVLEHVSTPVEMLRQIHPYVKPDGFLCVAVPNFASLQACLGREYWSHLDIPRHHIHYTPDTLKNILCRAGYTTQKIDHFSIEFNLMGVLQTTLNLIGCEPGLIYSLVKRNFSLHTSLSTCRYLYSVMMAGAGAPILLLPAFLFAYFESLIDKGGSILVYATPVESKS